MYLYMCTSSFIHVQLCIDLHIYMHIFFSHNLICPLTWTHTHAYRYIFVYILSCIQKFLWYIFLPSCYYTSICVCIFLLSVCCYRDILCSINTSFCIFVPVSVLVKAAYSCVCVMVCKPNCFIYNIDRSTVPLIQRTFFFYSCMYRHICKCM